MENVQPELVTKDPKRVRNAKTGPKVFYHASRASTARTLMGTAANAQAADIPAIAPLGKGEFGKGFYAFKEKWAAKAIAPIYARQHSEEEKAQLEPWAVMKLTIPRARWDEFKTRLYGGAGRGPTPPYQAWSRPNRKNPVVTWGRSQTDWSDVVHSDEKKKDYGRDLMKGPIKDKVKGEESGRPDQYLFAHGGLDLLNHPEVTREVISMGSSHPVDKGARQKLPQEFAGVTASRRGNVEAAASASSSAHVAAPVPAAAAVTPHAQALGILNRIGHAGVEHTEDDIRETINAADFHGKLSAILHRFNENRADTKLQAQAAKAVDNLRED